MPANAAAWYMAKRKFYMNQSFDQQLLPFLLKKYPEKFKVIGSSVVFQEVYKKDVAKAKLKYLVQYGLNAYFSHKADEYGVYFFDPFYYENTEPFHESLKQCTARPNIDNKSKLVCNYFNSPGVKEQFKFQQHSAYLVSISKQPGIKIVTNKTGVIISMINNQYGFIKVLLFINTSAHIFIFIFSSLETLARLPCSAASLCTRTGGSTLEILSSCPL